VSENEITFKYKGKVSQIRIGWYVCTICQIKCPYCTTAKYIGNGHLFSKRNADIFLDNLSKLNKPCHITITGGEPTLNPYLKYIIERLNKIESVQTYEVFTNGLNDLTKYNISSKGRIIVSYHPLVADIDKIINNINNIKNKIKITANIMVTNNIDPKVVDKYIEFCKSNGIFVHTQVPYVNYKVHYKFNHDLFDNDVFILNSKEYTTNQLYQNKLNCFLGWSCKMGSYDVIPDGSITDNCSKKIVGNINSNLNDIINNNFRICTKDSCIDEELLYYEKVLHR
jgi:organic radical activating enzyme